MILVTGATGLVGNNLVRQLLSRGERVRVFVRDPRSRALAGLDVDARVGDIADAEAVDRAVAGVDLVVHAAAAVRIGRRDRAILERVNVEGTRVVAESCRARGARLVHVSSVDALGWGTPSVPGTEDAPLTTDFGITYVRTKRAAEAVVADAVERGLDARTVNPTYVLGPHDWHPSSGRLLLEAVRRPWLPAPPGGNDFTHVGDVVSGILAAAERGARGARYILGGPHHTYSEAFVVFRIAAGGRGAARTMPKAMLGVAGYAGDVVAAITGIEPALNSGAVAASSHPHHFDDARARHALGYASRPLSETAADAWRWFVREGFARERFVRERFARG